MAAPTVAKSPPELVPPAGPTPGGVLPLSSIDKTAAVRVSVDFIQVFPPSSDRGGDDQVATMRQGFARALVPYYPVAGRIAEPSPGDLVVDCTGEGVWFVEATASCSLADVNGLERPLLIPKAELIPRPPPEEKLEDLILMAQVTKFTCGGFAVGICFSHLVFDGQGAAQFLQAAGELARGFPAPSVAPVWDRETIPDPPKLPRGPPPSFTAFSFVTQVVEISPESILRIKDEFKAATGETCSTFDAVTAAVFKCRALAVELADAAEVRLGFAASTRHLLQGVLPSVDGYYGNCVYPVGITRSSKTIREAPLPEVVGVMREAKEALKVRFTDWMHGGAKDDHYNVPLDYGTVTVSDWSRVGFNEVDYGFGEPGYVFTLNDDVNIVASVIYLKPPAPKRGIRLMLRCVEEPHAAVFADELAKYA
ncbi:acyl transferase 5-like [Triticum urartu]|uniref:3'-N-debenzoyl-2'-deoxytaxol N-benzoyltransferase n=1 Tax=Triticum urartu TaxID=4572 RepID=A0A8R7PS08_TRIUA|nr:acyl transferase 5-like [Triticum urartu]XP_048563725.1 acyl transferase 5-like [Triticum urartu]